MLQRYNIIETNCANFYERYNVTCKNRKGIDQTTIRSIMIGSNKREYSILIAPTSDFKYSYNTHW